MALLKISKNKLQQIQSNPLCFPFLSEVVQCKLLVPTKDFGAFINLFSESLSTLDLAFDSCISHPLKYFIYNFGRIYNHFIAAVINSPYTLMPLKNVEAPFWLLGHLCFPSM